jgi:hypothetical protein
MAFDSPKPRILTADEIWAIADTPERTIEIPEWGCSVRVRGLTLEEIAKVAERATVRNPRTNVDEQDRALLAAYTVITGMVEPKLSLSDLGRLRTRSATAITRIVQAISSLGATEDSVREADKSPGNGSLAALSVFPSPAIGGNDEGGAGEADVGA